MRIALLAPLVTTIAQPYVGGAQALLAELARGLVARGHRVTLFARTGSEVAGVPIECIDVPESVRPADFTQTDEERPTDTGFFAQGNIFLDLLLTLQQRRHEFDLAHAHAFDWPIFAGSALLEGLPILHTIHLPAVSPEINQALQVIHRQGHPLTLITVSQACAQTYAAYTPFDHVVYNGIDLSQIPFRAETTEDAPLLIAGRITPEKGIEAAMTIAEHANKHLLIAGGIYDQAYYEQRIAPRLKQEQDRVSYLGQLTQAALWKVMGEASGLLFPIEWEEPFGLTAIEAMACGTPVIAYKRGAAAEIIRHGKTGFLVEPGNIEQAAGLVKDLGTLSREACRKHIEKHFSLERMLDNYERVYRACLRNCK